MLTRTQTFAASQCYGKHARTSLPVLFLEFWFTYIRLHSYACVFTAWWFVTQKAVAFWYPEACVHSLTHLHPYSGPTGDVRGPAYSWPSSVKHCSHVSTCTRCYLRCESSSPLTQRDTCSLRTHLADVISSRTVRVRVRNPNPWDLGVQTCMAKIYSQPFGKLVPGSFVMVHSDMTQEQGRVKSANKYVVLGD
eukprot:227350-Amphidinium_carterae.1